MTIDSRLQVVEVVQMEVANTIEDMKMSLEDLRGKHDSLLNERSQAMKLAQIICPHYDASNEYWKNVHELSNEIKEVKREKDELEKKKNDMRRNNLQKSLITDDFLTSVTKTSNKTKIPSSITASTSPSNLTSNFSEDGNTMQEDDSGAANLFGGNDESTNVESV